MEERSLRDDDWNDSLFSREESLQKFSKSNSALLDVNAALQKKETEAGSVVQDSTGKGKNKNTNKDKDKKKTQGGAASFSTAAPTAQKPVSTAQIPGKSVESALPAGQVDTSTSEEHRKMVLNAPKRIFKIESMLKKHEEEMKKIDEIMADNGRDRGKLYDLQKDKDVIQKKIDKLYAEYEELIVLV